MDNEPIYDWPLTAFDIDDYKPTGVYSSDSNYHSYSDDVDLSGELNGIYYSAKKITLSNPNVSGDVTLVAEDEVDFSGNNHTLSPYINKLLAFGNLDKTCSDAAVKFSGEGSFWSGIVYSPVGEIYMSGNESAPNTLNGCLWGARVKLSGQEVTVQNCADYMSQSFVSLVE